MEKRSIELITLIGQQIHTHPKGEISTHYDWDFFKQYVMHINIRHNDYVCGFHIEFSFDFLAFEGALDAMAGPVSSGDLNAISLETFIEEKGIEVFQHLKSYNGIDDDYAAIAALANDMPGLFLCTRLDSVDANELRLEWIRSAGKRKH